MNVQFKIWRGGASGGKFCEYATEVSEGMVVLDAVHDIQRTQANDLACRWNCKAGKCGSCSAGCLPRVAPSPDARSLYRAALVELRVRFGYPPARHRRSGSGIARSPRDRVLLHHEMLH